MTNAKLEDLKLEVGYIWSEAKEIRSASCPWGALRKRL